jgi:hypothetical protein
MLMMHACAVGTIVSGRGWPQAVGLKEGGLEQFLLLFRLSCLLVRQPLTKAIHAQIHEVISITRPRNNTNCMS